MDSNWLIRIDFTRQNFIGSVPNPTPFYVCARAIDSGGKEGKVAEAYMTGAEFDEFVRLSANTEAGVVEAIQKLNAIRVIQNKQAESQQIIEQHKSVITDLQTNIDQVYDSMRGVV